MATDSTFCTNIFICLAYFSSNRRFGMGQFHNGSKTVGTNTFLLKPNVLFSYFLQRIMVSVVFAKLSVLSQAL